MNSQTVQIAKVSGLYRCIGLGQTKFAEPGQELPVHTCKGFPCAWELRAEDQRPSNEFIPMFVNKGIIMCAAISELPEVGMYYNFRSGMFSSYNGKWRVTKVGMIKWDGKDEIHVIAEKVGEIDPLLPIHTLATMTC